MCGAYQAGGPLNDLSSRTGIGFPNRGDELFLVQGLLIIENLTCHGIPEGLIDSLTPCDPFITRVALFARSSDNQVPIDGDATQEIRKGRIHIVKVIEKPYFNGIKLATLFWILDVVQIINLTKEHIDALILALPSPLIVGE